MFLLVLVQRGIQHNYMKSSVIIGIKEINTQNKIMEPTKLYSHPFSPNMHIAGPLSQKITLFDLLRALM
jgi:hypothetical protein